MKKFFAFIAVALLLSSSANADLIILGVTDGDLSGGNPKAMLVQATADIADMSIYGIGSANNGDGSDGEEFTFAGSALNGDVFAVVANTASFDFFTNYVELDATNTFVDGSASINGDDAIELFQSGAVIDTYGDINVDGNGTSWEYQDGYAVRIGGVAGAFDQLNYSSNNGVLDGLDAAQQSAAIGTAFGFTAVPEPSSLAVIALFGLAAFSRRQRA